MANRQYTVSAIVDSNKLQKSAKTALSTPIKVNVDTSQLSSDFKKISQTAQFNVNTTVNGQKIENATKILETWSNDAGKTVQVTKILNQENEQVAQSISKIGEKLTPFAKDMKTVRTETKTYTDELGRSVTESTKFNSAGEQLGTTTTRISENLNKAKTSTKEVGDELQKTSNKAKSFGSDFITTMGKVAKFFVITKIIQTFTQAIDEAIQTVKDLDDAMIDYQKVSDLSGDALTEYVNKLSDLGDAVYRNKIEMTESATLMKQAGYSDDDSAKLAQMANLYMNIADEQISASDSSSMLIGQMKAFNITADDSIQIIDGINEVSNKFAVSSSDLANNLGVVSSTLSANGTTFSESLALLTAITEKTRNASTAAHGLQQISSRLSQTLDDSSSTGKKLTKIYNDLGISLKDQNGQIKSTYDILSELAPKWDTLSKNEQTYIALTSSGSRQQNNFIALMSNFNTAIKANETAINSSGSAWEENEKRADSLTAKLSMLKKQFVDLVTGDGGLNTLLKGLIDLGTGILKFLNYTDGLQVGLTAISILLAIKVIPKLILFGSTLATNIGQIALFTAEAGSLSAGLKAVGISASTAQIALGGLTLILSAGIMAWNAYQQSQEDAKNSALDNISSLDSYTSSLQSTIDKINDESTSKESLIKMASKLDSSYDSEKAQLKDINELRQDAIEKLYLEAKAKAQATITETGAQASEAKSFLTSSYPTITEDGNLILTTVKDQLKTYKEIIDTYNERIQKGDDLNKKEQLHFNTITKAYTDLNKQIEDHQTALDGHNEAIKIASMSLKEWLSYAGEEQSQIENNTSLTNDNTDSNEDNSSSLEDMAKALSMSTDELEAQANTMGLSNDQFYEYQSAMDSFNDSIDSIQSTYSTLADYVDEYNSSEGVSLNTLQSVLPLLSEYGGSLQLVNGQLVLNEESIRNKVIAQAEEAKQTIYNTAIARLNAIAMGKSGKASTDSAQNKSDAVGGINDETDALNTNTKAKVANAAAEALARGGQGVSGEVSAVIEDMENGIGAIDKAMEGLGKNFANSMGKASNSAKSSAKSAAKSSTDAWKEAYEDEKDALDHKLAMEEISQEDYYKQLYALNEKYFNDTSEHHKQYLDDYQKNEETMYKGVKQMLEDMADDVKDKLKEQEDAALDSIDKQIDAVKKLESQKLDSIDKAIDALKNEKDEALNTIDDEINALKTEQSAVESAWNERIDKYKRANEELDKQNKLLEYQKALAQAQSTQVKVLGEDGTFGYQQDEDAVSEAQSNLDSYQQQLKYEAELQALEDSRDAELAVYDQKIADLEDYRDQVEASYDAQIEAMEAYRDQVQEQYDAEIEAMEEQKELIQEQYDTMIANYENMESKLFDDQVNAIVTESANWTTRLQNLASFVTDYNAMLSQLGMGGSVSVGYKAAGQEARASGDSSISESGAYVVGEDPHKEIVIGSKLNNGVAMNLSKGSGVVNAKSTNTLAGILNNLSGLSGNGITNSNTNNSQNVTNNFNITANVQDGAGLVDYLQNFSSRMTQEAFA